MATNNLYSSEAINHYQVDTIRRRSIQKNDLRSSLFSPRKFLLRVSWLEAVIKPGVEGHSIKRLLVGLKIVVPELLNFYGDKAPPGSDLHIQIVHLRDAVLQWEPSRKYDQQAVLFMRAFQEIAQVLFPDLASRLADELNKGWVADVTVNILDGELAEIVYYDFEKQKTIHNARLARKVGKWTVVSSTLLTHLRSQPLPNDDEVIIKELTFNDRVLIKEVITNQGGDTSNVWCFVMIPGGGEGYIQFDRLWTSSEAPDPFSRLHRIEPGETLLGLVNRYYFNEEAPSNENPDNPQIQDRRFYANILIFVNNPKGSEQKILRALNPATGLYDLEVTTTASLYSNSSNERIWSLEDVWLDPETGNPFTDVTLRLFSKIGSVLWTSIESALTGWQHFANFELKASSTDVNYFIWIPEKYFAQHLYHSVNLSDPTKTLGVWIRDKAKELWENEINDLKEKLDLIFAVGNLVNGVRLDASVGATFGIPLAIDLEYNCFLWRESDKVFKILRRGVIGGGLDAGAGAGAFLGLRKTPKNLQVGTNEEKSGIGAGLAAQLRAGIKFTVIQELTFPLDEDLALATLLLAVLQSTGADRSSLGHMLPLAFKFFNIDPNDYTTELSIEPAFYLNAQAGGFIGLRFGNSNQVTAWKNTNATTSFVKGEGNILNYLANYLSLTIGLGIGGELGGGVAMKAEPGTFILDPESGIRFPTKAGIEVYLEAKLLANIQLPILSALPFFALIPKDFGGGIKLLFEYEYDEQAFEEGNEDRHKFTDFRLEIYQKSGETATNFYDGTASQHTLGLNLGTPDLSPDNFLQSLTSLLPTSIDQFIGKLEKTEHFMRLSLSKIGGINSNFRDLLRNFKNINILVNHSGKPRYGAVLSGYLDFKFGMPGDAVKNLINEILLHIQQQNPDDTHLIAYIFDFLKALTSDSQQRKLLLDKIGDYLDQVTSDVIILHLEFGGGIGAGFQLGAGAKIRLRVYGGLALVVHRDIKTLADQYLANHELSVKQLLMMPLEAASHFFDEQ